MATNKERIEALEAGLGGVQDGIQRLEDTVNRLSEILLSTRESSNNHNNGREGFVRPQREENDSGRQIFSSKMVKLEFPKYSRADPTEWCNRVAQFFEFQDTADNQKVSLASFHLEGEANQWWQWLRRVYQEEDRVVTWELFEEELWARFGPIECEDFDEALSKVRQIGSLRDYQKEFERLGNRVHGWSQKALVGSFMGGLRSEISETIRMFKPKTLKEATSLARMKDEQLQRQRRISRPPLPIRTRWLYPQQQKPHLSRDYLGKRCKKDEHKDSVSTVMTNPLLAIDARVLNYFYWKVTSMMTQKETLKRPKLTFHLIPKFHYMP